MSEPLPTKPTSSRAPRLWLALGTWVALLVVLLAPTPAKALGVPLQPLQVQLQVVPTAAVKMEPGLLHPRRVLLAAFRLLAEKPDLDRVTWTLKSTRTVNQTASLYGIPVKQLIAMNPTFKKGKQKLEAGTKVVVFVHDPDNPTRSVGKCQKGRLISAQAFPEGAYWKLRPSRRRHYGTRVTVSAIVDAATAYGERFPGAPRIRIGELSQRRGGRVKPHRSHRSGRDADLGYVTTDDTGEGRWVDVRKDNLDVEKTWFFIKALLDTDMVEMMFMDKHIQKRLAKFASKELSDEELARIFEFPHRKGSSSAIIRHWKGHDEHVHIRFKCEPGNRHCR